MHVNILEVQNYMKVDAFRIDAQGNHVIISAANDSGKSSVVKGLYDGIQGVNLKLHPDPVRHGADKAVIKINTDEYLIERQIKPDGRSSLTVKTVDGKKVAGMTPHKLLSSLISEYSLDPVKFFNQREQDQIDDVLRVCGVKPPVDKVQEITGEPCPALPNETADKYLERLSKDETGVYYLKRRQINQEVETCRGALEKQNQLIAASKPPETVIRPTEIIMADIEACNTNAGILNKYRQELTKEEGTLSQMQRLITELTENTKSDVIANKTSLTQIEVYNKEISRLNSLIEGINLDIQKREARINDNTLRCDNGNKLITAQQEKIKSINLMIESFPNTDSNLKLFTDELKQSQEYQKNIVKYESIIERYDELVKAHEDSKRKHQAADVCLERLRDLRRNLLNDVDLGIEGLSIGEGELLLNGVSFKQASSAQRLTVAFCIAIKGNPALKLIRIDNGELLDSKSQEHLLKLASDAGYQVIMTRVSNEQGLSVQIIDR